MDLVTLSPYHCDGQRSVFPLLEGHGNVTFSVLISISINHSPYVFMQMVHLYLYTTTTDGNFFSSTKQISKRNLDIDSTDAASIKLNWHKPQSE